MTTADKIHRGGQQHIVDLAHTVKQLCVKMCEHDGIEPNASFVVFSDDNPWRKWHDLAMNQYYVGLKIGSR